MQNLSQWQKELELQLSDCGDKKHWSFEVIDYFRHSKTPSLCKESNENIILEKEV